MTKRFVTNITLYSGENEKKFESIDDLTIAKRGGSDEFKRVVENVKGFNKYTDRLFSTGAGKDDAELVPLQDYEKTAEYMKILDQSADDYLAKKMREKGVTQLKDLVGKNQYEKDRIEFVKKIKNYTSRHKIKDLTEDQREILKRNDEASVMELNKKIKEEVLKVKKESENKEPQKDGPVIS
ncbi:MAG: hypothetical protein IJM11_04295 [Firmicutes bacterium]|nr:hypothetical protein [Bacillota bacterium]